MNLAHLATFFEELTHSEQSESQATFLSIGGRGYYENPASDLLQFFLRPDNAHPFKTLFIEAFLEVADFSENPEVSENLSVQRELGTEDSKRIDLVITASKWLLMIENKIWHHQNNPFDSYEELASGLARGRQKLFAVLSPDGNSYQPNWVGVSYADFIQAINTRLAALDPSLKTNKWFVFAQDFTLHLSQELYTKEMTPEEIDFASKNQENLATAADLQQRYQNFLREHLPTVIPRPGGTATQENWCIRLRHPEWSKADIAWWPNPQENHAIGLSVYFENLTENELADAAEVFGKKHHLLHSWEAKGRIQLWRAESSFQSPKEAEILLQKMAEELFQLKSRWAEAH